MFHITAVSYTVATENGHFGCYTRLYGPSVCGGQIVPLIKYNLLFSGGGQCKANRGFFLNEAKQNEFFEKIR